jgi:hypothetical protein
MNTSDLPSMKTKCGVVVDDYDFETHYWAVSAVVTKTELSLNTDDLYVEFSPIVDVIAEMGWALGWALSEELC